MSGICGFLHLDGQPAELQLLEHMAEFMRFRGPDGLHLRLDGPIGLAHALLQTTTDGEPDTQPCSLDGRTWIVADARIDARSDLRAALRSRPRELTGRETDAELILHAYEAWGDQCLDHLLGDFAFAIWDGPRQRLLCARDHFGIKPFFYARVGRQLVFGNTIDCLRSHPKVSTDLDELAIADFLMFEASQNPESTGFRDIRRLPPGQCLIAENGHISTGQYWELPKVDAVRYRTEGDYIEHFSALLKEAVADRLRTDCISVEMSGGLDSTFIAALAKKQLSAAGKGEVHAHTIVHDSLIPSDEREFARAAAAHIGIPIHFIVADDYPMYVSQHNPRRRPDPSHLPDEPLMNDVTRACARHARVALTGEDGDMLLNESPKPYLRLLMREGQFGRALLMAVLYALSERRLVPHAARDLFKRRKSEPRPGIPDWLSTDLRERLDLRRRWERYSTKSLPHHLRPYAFSVLDLVMRVPHFWDDYDPGLTRQAIEYRHPFMDLRVVQYCLALPPVPWCVKKTLLREAAKEWLPEKVCARPKTPLGDAFTPRLSRLGSDWRHGLSSGLDQYLDSVTIPCVSSGSPSLWAAMRPLSLSLWLGGSLSKPTLPEQEP